MVAATVLPAAGIYGRQARRAFNGWWLPICRVPTTPVAADLLPAGMTAATTVSAGMAVLEFAG
jgi:hypothetical protein